MPAPPPALYAENVLEAAILTLTPGGAVAGKGAERLVDRDIGLECEDSGTAGQRIWHADRGVGASSPTVHVWAFAGAAYTGVLLTLESSPDNSAWTPRGTVTPASDAPQRVVLTPFTVPRYVRWHATNPPAPVRFTEVFLSPEVAFRWKPAAGSIQEPQQLNVDLVQSASGRAWGVRRGARRWSTSFLMTAAPDTDRTLLLSILDTLLDTAKPFWMLTVTSEFRWVRIVGAITTQGVSRSPSGEWDIPLTVLEELP